MPVITEFCRLGACANCANPACRHECHAALAPAAPRRGRGLAVLVLPPCMFCDRAAGVETTAFGVRADLCAEHASQYGADALSRPLRAGPAALPLPTGAEAGAYVESQAYRRARPTYLGRPQAPHEYVLLRRSTDPWTQLRVLAFIREHGERRRFQGSYHRYWTWGDYEYWELQPAWNTILNRRGLDWPTTPSEG
jgi:hypothetical protein